ncbi:hypothetical protein AgCh_011131 [Apium graveolens]
MRELLRIEIVIREVVPINEIHLICKWELGGKDFKLDLIPFRLRKFGVVLKMDWLSSNGAQIDYKGKKVKIRMPNGKEIVIKGQRKTQKFFNIAQAEQLLRKDSKAYLAYVTGTKREAPIIPMRKNNHTYGSRNFLGINRFYERSYHPQTDGQKFAYSHSYHASIEMPPHEAQYGRRCHSPLYWDEVGERKLLGPDLV